MDHADEQIVMAHGGGGEKTRRLIADRILPRLMNPLLAPLTDSAVVPIAGARVVFTTDAHVVQPIVFPGGDIGRLAICGTVNDLAVAGAIPQAISLALVMEEGLSLATLDGVLESIAHAAREAGVVVATGDTKVIERQHGDGLIITTAGIGALRDDARLDAGRIEAGDVVIVSGRIAEHGLAVMAAREGLGLQTDLRSDVAAVHELVSAMFDSGADLKFLRDPTRGGLAGVLADLADDTKLTVELHEQDIPIAPTARHLAELLGLDPLTVANEGKVVAVTRAADAPKLLAACRAHPLGRYASLCARFTAVQPAMVELITSAGGRRRVQRPYGEELPRIC